MVLYDEHPEMYELVDYKIETSGRCMPPTTFGVHLPDNKTVFTGGVFYEQHAIIVDFFTRSAINLPKMLGEHHTHSSCYLDGNVYVIGGLFKNNTDVSSLCERFNVNELIMSKQEI